MTSGADESSEIAASVASSTAATNHSIAATRIARSLLASSTLRSR